MNKRQQQKEREYFEKMKNTIIEDLKDRRHIAALSASIGKSVEEVSKYAKEWGVKDIYGIPE